MAADRNAEKVEMEKSEIAGFPGFPGAAPKNLKGAAGTGKFRWCKKAFGGTYSCPKEADDNPIPNAKAIVEALEMLGEGQYVIAEELHKDESRHYHVYWKFYEEFDTKNPRAFDIAGVHPNICWDAGKPGWINYITKFDNWITNFYVKKGDPWAEAYEAKTVDEAMEIIGRKRPREMILYRDRIQANLNGIMSAKRQKREIERLPFNLVLDLDFTKSVVLEGPPKIGKTQFAKTFGTHPAVIRHVDQLKSIPGHVDLLIFDDMDFGHWPRTSIIHLLDTEEDSPIHCRNTNALIPAGMKRIFTTNVRELFGPSPDEAITRRIQWITLPNKRLF